MLRPGVVPADHVYLAGAAGDSPFSPGEPLPAGTLLRVPTPAWYHPDVPAEPAIPFHERVIYRDRRIVVADKPRFLPTTTNGRIVRETLQTRLRVSLDEPDLVPAHRLDRLTAGVVLSISDPALRGAYQRLFAERAVAKEYRAQVEDTAGLPTQWQRIELPMRSLGAGLVGVAPGGRPTVTLLRATGPTTVALRPLTGHTHQLRVLLSHLGAPIIGDDTYPQPTGRGLYDFSTPLQLVAARLEFIDPVTGQRRVFRSRHRLGAG